MLMYHHVNPEGDSVNVRPRIFESHMRYLRERGFTALHTNEFLSIMKGRRLPPKRPVMITFDDGWLDNWMFAFPILKQYDMKAVIFIVTSLISEKGRRRRSDEGTVVGLPSHGECENMIAENRGSGVVLSWEELREMEGSGLIDIQSHTHTHQRWDKLYSDKVKRTDILREELEISKKIIEDKLNKHCNVLCWPWGKYDEDYVAAARSSGYELLFTTEKGTNTPATETWRIRRIVIGNIGTFTFRKKLFIHSRGWLSRAYLRYF